MIKNFLVIAISSLALLAFQSSNAQSSTQPTNKLTNVQLNSSNFSNHLYVISNNTQLNCKSQSAMITQYGINSNGGLEEMHDPIYFDSNIQSAYLSEASAAGGQTLHILLGCGRNQIIDYPVAEDGTVGKNSITHTLVVPNDPWRVSQNQALVPLNIVYHDYGANRLLYVTGSYNSDIGWLSIYPNNGDSLKPIQGGAYFYYGMLKSAMPISPIQFNPQFDHGMNYAYLLGFDAAALHGNTGEIQKVVIDPTTGLPTRYERSILTQTYSPIMNVYASFESSVFGYTLTSLDGIQVTNENMEKTSLVEVDNYFPISINTLSIHESRLFLGQAGDQIESSMILRFNLDSLSGSILSQSAGELDNFAGSIEKILFYDNSSEPNADNLLVLRNHENMNESVVGVIDSLSVPLTTNPSPPSYYHGREILKNNFRIIDGFLSN